MQEGSWSAAYDWLQAGINLVHARFAFLVGVKCACGVPGLSHSWQ